MAGGRRQQGRGKGGRGRGRGRGGRSGRGRGQQQQRMVRRGPPNWFNALNIYNHRLICSFLTKDEFTELGKAYPRFQPPKRTPQQQAAMDKRKKQMEAAQAAAKKKKEEEEAKKESADAVDNEKEAATNSEEKKEHDVDEKAEQTDSTTPNEEDDCLDEADAQEAAKEEQKAKKDDTKKNKDELKMSLADPQTLLARLNTKRLYRRLRFLQKEQKETSETKDETTNTISMYPLNMRTEQIANQEWQRLMVQYKQTKLKALEEQKAKQEAKVNDDDDNSEPALTEEGSTPESSSATTKAATEFPFPSSCELLLFSPCPRAVAVLASYPRSGNSLLRTLYERTTLRVTGSDMRGGLTQHDLVGEMAVQTNCVQFVKTHYPERMGTPPFRVSRAVLLVRNPYDAMESYFNLMMTNTHTTSLSDEQRAKTAQVFANMCQKEILVWRDFQEYWLQQKIPLLVIRYEDLIRDTDIVIGKVIRFVLEVNDMGFFEKRIDRAIREEMEVEKLGSYKPRSGGIGKSLARYPPELLQQINQSGIVNTMTKFGYDEMLVPTPSEWKLEPLDDHGVVIAGTPGAPPIAINQKGLVRGPKRQTNWRAIKRQMEGKEYKKCTCPRCVGAAQQQQQQQ